MTFLCACVLCCSPCFSSVGDLTAEFARSSAQTTSKPQPAAVSSAPARGTPVRAAPAAPSLATPAEPSLLEEVVANLKREPVGPTTLADLDMPDEFLTRVAGRILRASYEENFRIVVPDEKPADDKKAEAPTSASTAEASSSSTAEPVAASVPHDNEGSPAAGFRATPAVLAIFAGAGLGGAAIFLGIRRVRRGRANAR